MRHPSETEISAALDGHFYRVEPNNEVVDANAPTAPRRYREWTDDDLEHLIKLYREGLSYVVIEDILDRSHEGVNKKLSKLFRAGKLIARRLP